MATLEQLQQALIAADKAGATEDARALAHAILALKQAPAEQAKPQAEDPGMLQSLLIGAGRTTDRIVKGGQQMFYGMTGNDKALSDLRATAAEDDRIYQGLKDARPWATGIGEALPSFAVPVGSAATLAGNAGLMALAGAIPGALEYGTVGERAGRAGLGAVAGASVPVIGGALKTAKGFVEPLYQSGREAITGRLLNRVAGDSAPAVVSRLRGAPLPGGGFAGPEILVPGSMPTAAQVAESGGIAALERSALQANPEAYTRRAMEQASARLSALRGVAGDDAAMAAATGARDAAAGPLYAQAKAAAMDNTGQLSAALERLPPEVMAKAQRLAKLAGEPLKSGKDIPAQVVPSAILDAAGKPVTSAIPEQVSQYSGKALHYIKLALDDSINAVGEGSLGNTEKRLMTGAKDSFLSAVDAGIPAYGQARQEFAQLSRPVNQMEIGRELLNRVRPALSDFGALGRESGATYARALRDGDALAASATGMKSAKLADVMNPQQMQTLSGVGQDLARKANAQDLGRGVGSDTFQKLAMSNIAEQSGMPRMMGGLLSMPGVSRATRWLYQDADKQMQGLLSDTLLNPAATAQIMTKAERKLLADNPKTRKLLEQAILRSGLLGAPSAYSLAD